MWHTQHDLALKTGMGQPPKRLIVQRQHLARIARQLLARRHQRDFAPGPVQQRDLQHILQPLDLHHPI